MTEDIKVDRKNKTVLVKGVRADSQRMKDLEEFYCKAGYSFGYLPYTWQERRRNLVEKIKRFYGIK